MQPIASGATAMLAEAAGMEEDAVRRLLVDALAEVQDLETRLVEV